MSNLSARNVPRGGACPALPGLIGEAQEGGEVPQATQLVNIKGRGPNQQLEGLREGRGHVQLVEEGSQRREQSIGVRKPSSNRDPEDVQAGGETEETTGVAREEGAWMGNRAGGG